MVAPVARPASAERVLPPRVAVQPVVVVRAGPAAVVAAENRPSTTRDLKLNKPPGGRLIVSRHALESIGGPSSPALSTRPFGAQKARSPSVACDRTMRSASHQNRQAPCPRLSWTCASTSSPARYSATDRFKARIDAAIGERALSCRFALLVAHELVIAGIAIVLPLQAVRVILRADGARRVTAIAPAKTR
jgi:hypothetical protein